jgi:hypothetical protein
MEIGTRFSTDKAQGFAKLSFAAYAGISGAAVGSSQSIGLR